MANELLRLELRRLLEDVSEEDLEEASSLYTATADICIEHFCQLWVADKVLGGMLLGKLREKRKAYVQEEKANPLFKEFAQPFHKSVFAAVFAHRLSEKLANMRAIFGSGKVS